MVVVVVVMMVIVAVGVASSRTDIILSFTLLSLKSVVGSYSSLCSLHFAL
jgi:hypothetical protein